MFTVNKLKISGFKSFAHPIELLIEDSVYEKRMQAYQPKPPKETRGVLAKYAAIVATASEGAVTDKNLNL